jgi:hypothetical protein
MGNQRREGRTSRRPATARRLSTRLLIVCGGLRTEKLYFDGLRRAEHNPAVTVVLKTHPKSPTEVVRHARTIRRDNRDDFDEVWCVLDVDQFQDISQAATLAKKSGIKVAISNPCFELWLLLHLAAHTAHISTRDVQRLLCRHLPGYDKSDLSFDDFASGVGDAYERSRELEPTGRAHDVNPSTNVWQLMIKIRRAEVPK